MDTAHAEAAVDLATVRAAVSSDELDTIVNTTPYPLTDPSAPCWRQAVSHARADLKTLGCAVLRDFIAPHLIADLRRASARLAPSAHRSVETVNVYNIAADTALPAGHPGRVTFTRGNAFVARDHIPADSILARLYTSAAFQNFVAACFGLDRVHELADPLAGLCLNVVDPGGEHPWHFDTNEFTVSLLTQAPAAGGVFEYCPGIRSRRAENLDAVGRVLAGNGGPAVRRLRLRPGDLQLFNGRYSLHRVCPVAGSRARLSAIFAYSERSGVLGSVERTRQLFGRVTPAHRGTDTAAARVDALLD